MTIIAHLEAEVWKNPKDPYLHCEEFCNADMHSPEVKKAFSECINNGFLAPRVTLEDTETPGDSDNRYYGTYSYDKSGNVERFIHPYNYQ